MPDSKGAAAELRSTAPGSVDRTTLQERLARSEARFAEAQRVAHVGSFEWEVATDVVTWSDELHRIYGLQPGEFGGTYSAFLDHVYPEDLDATVSVIVKAYEEGRPFAYEHRVVRRDGSVRLLRTQGDVVVNDAGAPLRLVGSCWDITEIGDFREREARTRSLLEATIESTADGILVVDLEGHVTIHNERFLTMWGFPPELSRELDDQKLITFVLDQLEDPDGFILELERLYEHPEEEDSQVLRFKDGRVFERVSRPQRLGKVVVGRVWTFQDVSERERLLRRALFLSDASRLLSSLDVEPALDGVAHLCVPYLADHCAIDLIDNGVVRRLVAIPFGAEDPIRPTLHESVAAGHPSTFSSGPDTCLSAPFVVKGETVGALTFLVKPPRVFGEPTMDMAIKVAARAALLIENARVYQAARDAIQARDEFLSIAAHEIRGPVTSMHLAVQGLKTGRVNPRATPAVLGVIAREDRRLGRFVEELLDVGRIRSGAFHLQFEECNLDRIVREAAKRLNSELVRSGSTLSIKSPGHVIVGTWDPARLDQIVTNLLLNACKYGRGRPIELELTDEPTAVRFRVSDQGIGIPAELQPQIFQPFARATSIRHYGGLGLGLYIVRTIVEGMGGTVRFESTVDVGSTFVVELPKARAS